MTDKIHRLIYFISLIIISLFGLLYVVWRLFFEKEVFSKPIVDLFALLGVLTPLAIIGTLFGTLKESQSSERKVSIIIFTISGALLSAIIIIGGFFAATFD